MTGVTRQARDYGESVAKLVVAHADFAHVWQQVSYCMVLQFISLYPLSSLITVVVHGIPSHVSLLYTHTRARPHTHTHVHTYTVSLTPHGSLISLSLSQHRSHLMLSLSLTRTSLTTHASLISRTACGCNVCVASVWLFHT